VSAVVASSRAAGPGALVAQPAIVKADTEAKNDLRRMSGAVIAFSPLPDFRARLSGRLREA
jgi:hypothetical protein